MTSEQTACFACDQRFEAEALVRVGDAMFCRRCLDRMMNRGAAPVAAPAVGSAPIAAPASPSNDPPCFVCGEPIDRGATAELRGFPLCARCARSLVGEAAPPLSAAPPAHSPPPSSITVDTIVCDACDRAVLARLLAEREGFQLCAACRHSDPDLAMALARARHQRRLTRAGRQLLNGDD